MGPVVPLCPGPSAPTWLMGGQSVWMGWGLEAISWACVSLFTNVTVWVTEMFTFCGPGRGEGMGRGARVAAGGGVGSGAGWGVGEVEDPPPQDPTVMERTARPAAASSPGRREHADRMEEDMSSPREPMKSG